jgi:hypothetical protein
MQAAVGAYNTLSVHTDAILCFYQEKPILHSVQSIFSRVSIYIYLLPTKEKRKDLNFGQCNWDHTNGSICSCDLPQVYTN